MELDRSELKTGTSQDNTRLPHINPTTQNGRRIKLQSQGGEPSQSRQDSPRSFCKVQSPDGGPGWDRRIESKRIKWDGCSGGWQWKRDGGRTKGLQRVLSLGGGPGRNRGMDQRGSSMSRVPAECHGGAEGTNQGLSCLKSCRRAWAEPAKQGALMKPAEHRVWAELPQKLPQGPWQREWVAL